MSQEQASSCSVQSLVTEAIDALTHWDADRLEAIERSASALPGNPPVENVTDTVTNINVLGRLLEETRRNLHVFKLLEARKYQQEDAQGYAGIPASR